jgi:predicted 3-demethylubiquinone-9 3-methyltransferase (glyoxalase superfamily)
MDRRIHALRSAVRRAQWRPPFPHSEAVSFMVSCDTQEELDSVWDSLIADGGEESRCGWCRDRFGVSWQIVPRDLPELLSAGAWSALEPMTRIDIAALRTAVT